ncbi:MAG: transposase [Candidatus Polarisedimenticolia bacterium]
MKKIRFGKAQIVGILKEADAGVRVGELCRKYGISDQTYCRWKAEYGGMEAGDAARLRALENENRKLKMIVAEQALGIRVLKDIASREW